MSRLVLAMNLLIVTYVWGIPKDVSCRCAVRWMVVDCPVFECREMKPGSDRSEQMLSCTRKDLKKYNMVTVTDHRERYLLAFAQAEPVLMERGPGWLHGLRREAIAHFKEIGFPDRRVEEWRFTNIRPIVEQTFVPAEKAPRPISQDLFQLHAYAEHCHLITFINGFYSPELSDLGDLPENIIVQSLSEAWQERESLLEPHIARKGSFENNPFAALNTAFMQDGIYTSAKRYGSGKTDTYPVLFRHSGRTGDFLSPQSDRGGFQQSGNCDRELRGAAGSDLFH